MKRVITLSSLLAALACSATAAAQVASEAPEHEGAVQDESVVYPITRTHRPETLPAGAFRIDAQMVLSRDRPRNVVDSLDLGLAYGLLSGLEIGATLAPLTLGLVDSELGYGDPSLYVRYQLLRSQIELGVLAHGTIPIGEESDPSFSLGAIACAKPDDLKIEFGLRAGVTLAEETIVALNLPIALRYSVTERVFFGGMTGLSVSDISALGDSWSIPFGTLGGLSFGEEMPVLDLWLALVFPHFASSEGTATDLWTLTLGARFFLGV